MAQTGSRTEEHPQRASAELREFPSDEPPSAVAAGDRAFPPRRAGSMIARNPALSAPIHLHRPVRFAWARQIRNPVLIAGRATHALAGSIATPGAIRRAHAAPSWEQIAELVSRQ